MNYPIRLLPKKNYKKINCNIDEHHLIRHCHLSGKDMFNDLGEIKDEVIGMKNQLPDCSCSLLGVYKFDDIKIEIKKDSLYEYCSPDFELSDSLIFKKDFDLRTNRGFWCLKVENINKKEVRYDDNNFKATCYVLHSPTKCNFWHFSLNWYIDDKGDYWHNLSDNKILTRMLKTKVRALLKTKCTTNRVYTNNINQKCYTK